MAGSGPGCPQPCQRLERGRRGTWELGLTSHCPSPSTLRSTHMQTCSCRQAYMWLADAQRPTDQSMSTCMAPITRNRVLSHPRPYVTQTERHRRMTHTLTHMLTHTYAAQIHEKAGHMHTHPHTSISRETEHTHAQILQTYTEHTNLHTLQSTYSWTQSRGSQTPCHILDRHGCIEYTKTLKAKDTCTQTHLAHVHTGMHTHPQCVLTFCMRAPCPLPLLPSPLANRHGQGQSLLDEGPAFRLDSQN